MDCGKIRKDLHAYLEGLTTPEEKKAVEEHCAQCSGCRTALEELRLTVRQLNELEELEPPAWLTQKVMAGIRDKKTAQRGILSRFFGGLRMGIPVTAAATLLLGVTAVLIYREMEPQVEKTLSPVATEQTAAPLQQAPQSEAPQPRTEQPRDTGRADSIRADSLKEAREASPPMTSAAPADKPMQAPQPPAEEPARQRSIEAAPKKKELLREGYQDDRLSQARENKAAAARRELSAPASSPPASVPQKPASVLPRAGALKDEYYAPRPAPGPAAAGARLRAQHEKAVGKAISPYERRVIEKHSNGSDRLVITYWSVSGKKIKFMEEGYDELGRRHGRHAAYDENERQSAEVIYEHGRIVSVREYRPDGTLKTGESKQDWPWLKSDIKQLP
ncbi:MAG: zf-HC2 domain-containing protein [Thermodesulfovibrionales bacterium]